MSNLDGGAIAGIVIGCVVGAILFACLFVYCYRRSQVELEYRHAEVRYGLAVGRIFDETQPITAGDARTPSSGSSASDLA